MSIKLDSSIIKSGLALVKIIKPASGDYSIKFNPNGTILLVSLDKRRSITVKLTHGEKSDLESEYYLSTDRIAVFETDLKNLSLSETDKGLIIKYSEEGVSRTALLKRRSGNSKRQTPPGLPRDIEFNDISAKKLDYILKMAACSALVKETHTEEDMRINQIHFYAQDTHVTSNARFYGTQVSCCDLAFDISIVSADIPFIRNFCARCKGNVSIGQDSDNLYILDRQTDSWMHVSKVACQRPKPKLINVPSADKRFSIPSDSFKSITRWLSNSLDTTQRVTMKLSRDGDLYYLKFISSLGVELSSNIVQASSEFSGDFPISVLQTISDHLIDGDLDLYFSVSGLPDVLVLSQNNENVSANHFLRSMRPR